MKNSITFLVILIVSVNCNNNNNNFLDEPLQSGKNSNNKNAVSHKNDVGFNSRFQEVPGGASNPSSSAGGGRSKSAQNVHGRIENELNSVPANFNNVDEDETYEDEDDADYNDSYEDEPTGSNANKWGADFENNDINEIISAEKGHSGKGNGGKDRGVKKKPQMAKCCGIGEGLNSQGQCKPHHSHHHQPVHLEHSTWFPQRIFDFEKNNWTVPDVNDWAITTSHYVKCPENESSELISDTDKFAITNHGKLFVLHRENKEVDELDFCVDLLLGEGKSAVRSCFTKTELCPSELLCLRKCCPEDLMVQEPHGGCVFSATHKHISKFPTDKYNVVHGSPTCKFGQYVKEVAEFTIDADASFVSLTANTSFDNYCVDFFLETSNFHKNTHSSNSLDNKNLDEHGNEKKSLSTIAPIKLPVLKVVMCFETYDNEYQNRLDEAGLHVIGRIEAVIYGITFILSVICILLAIIISWRLPELHSLHGKCQLCHLATLLCLFLLLSIVYLISEELPSAVCTTFGVLIHILALSAFLWLNLLCVNIYLTFRSLRPPLAARRGENRRLFFLCIYAWGIPAAFCTFLYTLETLEPGRLAPMPEPQYGEFRCLISNRKAEFAYLYGPVGLLLLINGILFCLTAKELLYGLWRLDNSDSINFRRKSMGMVVGKLAVVMGIGWIFDVLSWAVGGPLPWIFYFSDMFNALQGVFIFLVLIWRKRVLEMLHLRKPSLIKDETLTGRPFLPKSSVTTLHGDNHGKNGHRGGVGADADTSLALLAQENA